MIGAGHKGALVTAVERVSKYLVMAAVPCKTMDLVGCALASLLEPLKPVVLTVTADNGKEFAGHRELAAALDADVYFARPCHSWERGLNEHTSGLARQYFGKSESLLDIEPSKVRDVAGLLNGRPR